MLHHESVTRVQSKECYCMLIYTLFGIFVAVVVVAVVVVIAFHQKVCAFIIFSSFFDEV